MVRTPDILRYSAFAATADGGNPAGVVLDASMLDDAAMQRIAAEVGFSETAFVTGRSDDHGGAPRLAVRYWSPAAEVPFCGHATVATAVALAEREGPGEVVFETAVGPVTLNSRTDAVGVVTVSFTSVEPEVRALDPGVRDTLLGLLGLAASDIDEHFPVREAFAGNWHPIVVLADREIFHQFRFAPAQVADLMREQGWRGTVTVLHASGPREFEARNLFPVGRITEDPATGSAAAAVGAYLRDLGTAETHILIRQGRHVGRPSELRVAIPTTGGITVAGGATPIVLPSAKNG